MNVEELKQACSDYFSRYYSEFEDYFYVVVDNNFRTIDLFDFVLFFTNKKFDGIAFKIVEKHKKANERQKVVYDVDKKYKIVYITSVNEFEAALSSYLKNYLYKN
jgi:hypothetical protein